MVILAGLLLAGLSVLLVLEPLIRPAPPVEPPEPERDPALERRDLALAALKEIEFDRATGKLSDADYGRLRERYTAEAVAALRATDAPSTTGSDEDAVERLIAQTREMVRGKRFCSECGSMLEGSGRYCVECGSATNVASRA
jgi:hypothetical protein